jgi:hypothetical protein
MTEIVTKRFVACPGCGVHDHLVEHLFGDADREFGPWTCQTDDCLTEISGTVHPDGTIDAHSKVNPKRRHGFALLKLRDLYLVKKELYGRVEADHTDYFYHSHQCPMNLLQDLVAVYGPNGDEDPHGLIRYVAGIDDTPETREALCGRFGTRPTLRKIMSLFETDGEPIATDWPEKNEGMIPWIAEMRREEIKKS